MNFIITLYQVNISILILTSFILYEADRSLNKIREYKSSKSHSVALKRTIRPSSAKKERKVLYITVSNSGLARIANPEKCFCKPNLPTGPSPPSGMLLTVKIDGENTVPWDYLRFYLTAIKTPIFKYRVTFSQYVKTRSMFGRINMSRTSVRVVEMIHRDLIPPND